ncbi:diguanylate cyclase [Pseudomonas baltica]|uniref:sensor domain-containing diguanylate cyclase n=1 Tax=Pseudomonas baltica TaxID=2762576 RepID=UPI00289EB321|nr:diguanylate cyclase [Pseudomonas baltica]
MIERTHRRRDLPERALILGCVLAMAAIIALVTFMLVREHSSAKLAAIRASSNVVQLIDTEVQRNIDLYDASLQGLIETSQNPDFGAIPTRLQRSMLFGKATGAPLRGDLLWIDAQGNIVADSLADPPRKANFAGWPEFRAHREHVDSGLIVSRPFLDQIGTLGWCISLSRRITSPSGQFLGVASGALRLDYFNNLFKSLNIGSDSSVSLMSDEGFMLAREPLSIGDAVAGADYSHRGNFLAIMAGGTSGSFVAVSGNDKKARLYTFGRVGKLPMIVVVAVSTEVVYGAWRRTAVLVCTATGGLCLGILWLGALLRRELKKRQRAERKLATLAATDSLTGLANRRQLDLTLNREWLRALRTHKPLSVLMIDVDHFKAFNERHGHQGGDDALRAVANTLRHCTHRPADLAARYGGEEFVVVLAETPLEGARTIAETIRLAVEQQSVLGSTRLSVTVSIGVGSTTLEGVDSLAALLAEADAALYRAKRNGRNQVACARSPGFELSPS